jgi:hypothetical protein
MSVDVYIDLKGLMALKGFELIAELNGSVEQAQVEFRSLKPDPHYIEHLLTPCVLMRLPGYQYSRVVDVMGNKVHICCGSTSTFLRFIIGFCDQMDLNYSITGI